MQSNVSFSLFAKSAQQQSECPPAGASQEVNEAAPSLAAPSASGQQAGTPRNPWKTTEVRISPSLVYVLALMLDDEWEFHPGTYREHVALQACIRRGWVRRCFDRQQRLYQLTADGKAVAEVCHLFIAVSIAGSVA